MEPGVTRSIYAYVYRFPVTVRRIPMRRPLIALAATAALIGAATPAFGSSRPAINPELVNPVVVAAGFNGGELIPSNPSGMIVPTPPMNFWMSSSGYLPLLTTSPDDAPEIVMPDVQERMSILYVTDPAAKEILGSSTGMRALPWLFRQEPSNSGGDAALAGGGTQRMWKVSGSALAAKPTADAMAAMLKAAVDRRCVTPAGVNTCGASRVGVDEIGSVFGTPAGESDAGSPGERLKNAMIALAKKSFQPGVSYASRIHFYVAPGVSTSISAGLGPNRTLGENGKEMRRNYSQVMSAMSRAGGVWLEMYNYPERGKARRPFSAADWRDVPTNFAAFLKERTTGDRNPLNYLHFVLTDTPGAPAPAPERCMDKPASGASPNSVAPGDANPTLDTLPACPASPPPPCPVLKPAGANERFADTARIARVWSRRPVRPSPRPRPVVTPIRNDASKSMVPATPAPTVRLAVLAPDDSGMTCQWKRAQGSDVNTRILANGPAAFKVTGSEARIFGEQFRQFFIVG